jgi:UDP-glucose 4-epimerase
MALVWVIGSGGLLGQALLSELSYAGERLFDPATKFSWNDPSLACEEFKQAADTFSHEAEQGPWTIYWAAGTGTMHSNEETMQAETNILTALISYLLNNANLNLNAGTFAFASSAGAIYAGAQDGVITESTLPAPINAYGRAKLAQETVINRLNQNGQGTNIISCRITTLYGFKLKQGKQQGLIAEMIRRAISNDVVHIYVPLETMRNYITARDAATQMIATVARIKETPGTHLKIIAAKTSTSIAQILAILKRICKRNLRVVTQADIRSTQYQRVVQFESNTKSYSNSYLSQGHLKQTSLTEGISELLAEIQQDIAQNGTNP